MLELSNDLVVIGSLLLAIAAWIRFGAKPALGTFALAVAATRGL